MGHGFESQSCHVPFSSPVTFISLQSLCAQRSLALLYYQYSFELQKKELTLYLPVLSADNLGKQFGSRSGPTIRRS